MRARSDNPAAVLLQRLEALASQFAELESLRDRVNREEERQRGRCKPGYVRKAIQLRGQASVRCKLAYLKSKPAPLVRNSIELSRRVSESERMARF